MKLYEILNAIDLRHSDKFDDYENVEICFVEDGDAEVIPNELRAILKFADCFVDSVGFDIRNGQPIISIIITKEETYTPSIDLIRNHPYLLT